MEAAWLPVEVLAVGMVTPVGLTAGATAAAIRAGIIRVKRSSAWSRRAKLLPLGFLEEQHLPPLQGVLATWATTAPIRHQRLLRLAAGALREVAAGSRQPLPLVLALPEPPPGATETLDSSFLERLAAQSGVPIDLRGSQLIFEGRAGGLLAVEHAVRLLRSSRVPGVLVGGVDTYLDERLLTALAAEGRLHGDGPSDGFCPGEGAAFLRLAAPGDRRRQGGAPLAHITSLGVGQEPGHRYSDEPYLGEGLARAFRELFQRWPGASRQVRCVYAGFNGESFWAKEWGVAYLRHSRAFAEPFQLEHPAECTGDPGAALGPMMLALAALGLRKGYREGPCLVWCSSDRDARAVAMVEATPT